MSADHTTNGDDAVLNVQVAAAEFDDYDAALAHRPAAKPARPHSRRRKAGRPYKSTRGWSGASACTSGVTAAQSGSSVRHSRHPGVVAVTQGFPYPTETPIDGWGGAGVLTDGDGDVVGPMVVYDGATPIGPRCGWCGATLPKAET